MFLHLLRSHLVALPALTFAVALLSPIAAQEKDGSLPQAAVKQFEWRNIGPANMGGRITALAVYEADPNTWWAASASGGLLKTTNNGVTFEHQFDREATVSIGDVQVSQSNPDVLWVGTGEGNPRNSSSWGDGVYKSTDGGKTWKNMGLKKIFQTGRIAIHPTNPDIVYVGALGRLWGPSEDRGLYKTIDGGENWEKVLYVDDKTGVIDVQMNQDEPDTVLVATYERKRDGFDGNDPEVKFGAGAGIYRTTDGGKSFARVTQGLPTVNMGRIGISIYRNDPQQVYAVIESEKIGKAPENFPFVGFSGSSIEAGARVNSVTKDSSADQGGLKENDIVIAVDGERVLNYGDLQKLIRAKSSGDEAVWEVLRDGDTVELTLTYGKREEPSEEQRERESRMRSNPRSPFSASLGGQVANLQGQQGEDEADYGGVYHSADGGATWKRINSVNPRPMYYSQIRVDPSDNQHLYVLGTSLFRSKDGGEEFTSDGAGGEVHVDHHALWIDPRDGRHMILGNDGGIYVTHDRMENWDHHNHVAIAQFYHVGVAADEDYHVYGGLQDNGSWGGPTRVRDNSGPENSDWYRVGSGDGFVCLVDPNDPNQIYFESQNGAMGRIHLETGERGFIRPRAPRGTRYRFNWKTPFILSPHNSKIHYSAGNHVFRSVAKGDRTESISPEITNTDKGAGSAITESPRQAGVLYVGTTDGAMWMTKDNGKTWVNLYDEESLAAAQESQAEANRGPGRGASADEQSGGRPGSGRTGRGRGRGGRNPGRMLEMLRQQDKNNDGTIEADELPQQMRPIIGRLDKNGDGKLTSDELKLPGQTDEESAESDDEEAAGSTDKAAESEEERPPSPKSSAKSTLDASEATAEEPPQEKSDTQKSDAENATDDSDSESGDREKQEPEPSDGKPSLAGKWKGEFVSDNIPPGDNSFELVLAVDSENKIKGSFESSRSEGDIAEGEFDAESNSVKFVIQTERSDIEATAKLSGTNMNGTLDINGGAFSIDFEATRTGDASVASDASEKEDDGSKPLYELVPEPRWVSSLTASAFENGRCYVTLDGHRSDDDEPYLFATENFGQTWRSIRANLPTEAGSTRVLREDIENPNVLYLGCEFSVWISIDRGESWTRMNSNLPTVAVHELAQHPTRGEIVAGTHGRSLWIMDVTTLRQLSTETLAEDAYLYAPNKVIRWKSNPRRGSPGTRRYTGDNPDGGAVLAYSLGKNARSAKLTVTDLLGEELFEQEVPTQAGLHTVDWDTRRQSDNPRSRFSAPAGKYRITLRVDGKELHQVLEISGDPDYPSNSVRSDEAAEFWEEVFGSEGEEESDDVSEALDADI